MPKITITPLDLFKLEISVVDIPTTDMKYEFMDIIDELTRPHVGPNDFWDGCELERYYQERILVIHPIEGDKVSDFICKVNAEYDKFKLEKGF